MIPVWHTDAYLADAVESNAAVIPLTAINTGSATIQPGTTELALGFDSALVTKVRFNGTEVAYNSSGSSLIFSPVSVKTVVEMETSIPLMYGLIGGKLPKGMMVSQQGVLSGVPEGIRDENGELYTFTVRAVNNDEVRDRTFRMLVHPIAQTAVWNMSGLPLESADASLSSHPFRVLGEVKRGEAFLASIDVSHPDGDTVTVGIRSSDGIVPRASSFNGRLPDGLKLNGTEIEGVVLPSTAPGKYFFTLAVVAPSAPAPIPMMIEVLSLRSTSFKRPVKMVWVTEAGSLGSVKELDICNLSVTARNPNGAAINYNLLAGTGGLPPGLILNPQTGDIEGQVLFVPANTSYSFTVRASSESIFVDRTFSIDVKDQFSAEDISEVSFKFQGRDKKMALKGYQDVIPSDWLYRSLDKNFGLVTEPYVHVARGLHPDATLSKLDYRENVLCIFGPHAIATILDAKGKVKYEVLYRKIIDPMDQDFLGLDVRENGLTINYRQSKVSQNIHPMSIWNMRYDLLSDYGTDKGDLIPEWMDKDTNLPGFKTAYAIAFLQPGTGKQVLELIADNTNICQNGYEVKFDRVLLSRIGHQVTTFDGTELRMLPVYIPANVSSATMGKWTQLVTEIFSVEVVMSNMNQRLARPSSISAIDQNFINLNVDAGTISFPAKSFDRMLFFFISGTPPNGLSCSNAPIGNTLVMGPFANGVSSITINNLVVPLTAFTFNTSDGVAKYSSNFSAGSEVVINLSETTFDDQDRSDRVTLFDFQAIPIGKYIKLTNEFKKYPS